MRRNIANGRGAPLWKYLLAFPTWATRNLLVVSVYWLAGLLVGGGIVLGFVVDRMPDLHPWHEVELTHEYSVDAYPGVASMADYRALEDALFEELENKLFASQALGNNTDLNRYVQNSRVDPTSYPVNWNRTRSFPVESPRAGVLLLHGLSDSPYSLRELALQLHAKNVAVVLPRLPGHGTVPASLTRVQAEDFKALVRIAVEDLRRQTGAETPIYIVGYSTGATLALDYALSALENGSGSVTGLVLISPAIGVSPLAALASWQRHLSVLPGLEKLSWQSVLPEFDPYKYNSFPLNAAEQVYDLTRQLSTRINRLSQSEALSGMPPILAISSAVDATVSVPALIDNLLKKLPGEPHRLLIYDVNQEANAAFLLADNTQGFCEQLLRQELPFRLDVLTNQNAESRNIVRKTKPAHSRLVSVDETGLSWPGELYSLSHVALPFPPDDPAYGNIPKLNEQVTSLGNVVLRGERGVLKVPISHFTRLRYNPFYKFQEQQILSFVLGDNGSNAGSAPDAD